MKRIRDYTIKNKLTFIVMLASSVALLVACIVFIIYDRSNTRKEMVNNLEILADIIGSNSTAAITFDSKSDADETLTALKAEKHIVAACIYDENGEMFSKYIRDKGKHLFLPNNPEEPSHSFVKNSLILFRKIMLNENKPIGTVYLQSDLTAMGYRLQRFIVTLAAVMLLALVTAFIVTARLQRVISDPIKHLANIARDVSQDKDYSVRAVKHGNDEFGLLIEKFNEMLIQIQTRDAALQTARDSLEYRVKERTKELESEVIERTKAEEALRDREELLRATLESTVDGILVVDKYGRITHTNARFVEMWRIPLELMTSGNDDILLDFVTNQLQDPQAFIDKVQKLYDSSEDSFDTIHFIDSRVFERFSCPLITDDETSGRVWNFRDVTEQRRFQEAQSIVLRISEAANDTHNVEELAKMVCNELAVIIDTKNFFIAIYNEEKNVYSFPYSRDQIDGVDFPIQSLKKSLTDYVRRSGKSILVNDRVFEKLKAEGEIKLLGHPAPIWMGVPLKISGKTIGAMVVQNYHDPERYNEGDLKLMSFVAESISRVIERVRAEEHEMELREKLERAERMESLGILAGGVAHDLNNMLGPLVGYPELILRKLPEDSSIRSQIQKISRSAQDAADVIQDLLTLARRGRYEMSSTNLNDVINSYIDTPSFIKLCEGNRNVDLDIQLANKLPNIYGSSAHLQKVIMNLIINAFDAMQTGGRLIIHTSHKYINVLESGHEQIEPGNYVICQVKDTGMGISSEDINKIFEPYFSKKKLGASGSGLGLSVVYGILKDHKGYYDIFSKEGEGTEFILYLPIYEDKEEQFTLDDINIEGIENVLVVDDVEEQRVLAADFLTNLGYNVNTVNNGHEAIKYLKDNEAELVILDMIMERDFDGLDTFREIITFKPDQKVIIVSGFSATERVVEMQKLGAGQYIRKPYTLDSLGRAVRIELDKGKVVVEA